MATSCFDMAAALSDHLLSGSHPIRLSVKMEYAAYMYDCLHDGEGSRKLAQQTIKDVYNAQEKIDNDRFEDAAEMVGILGKMMKRGLGSSGGSGSTRHGGSAGTLSNPAAMPLSSRAEIETPRAAVPPSRPSPIR